MNIHSSFIHNSPKLERNEMLINRRTYSPNNGISIRWNRAAKSDLLIPVPPRFPKHYAWWRKSNTKCSLHGIPFTWILEKGHWIYRNSRSVVAWGPVEGGLATEEWGNFWGWEDVVHLDYGGFTKMCTSTKTQQTTLKIDVLLYVSYTSIKFDVKKSTHSQSFILASTPFVVWPLLASPSPCTPPSPPSTLHLLPASCFLLSTPRKPPAPETTVAGSWVQEPDSNSGFEAVGSWGDRSSFLTSFPQFSYP